MIISPKGFALSARGFQSRAIFGYLPPAIGLALPFGTADNPPITGLSSPSYPPYAGNTPNFPASALGKRTRLHFPPDRL
jgi:hypothetical protein